MQPIATAAELGAIVKSERKRQKLTQTDLADACNVGLSFIVNLEHGKQSAEVGKCLLVLQTLGIDLFAEKRGE